MGFQEKTSSGRAISLRIKQAILALVRIFMNYRYTKECIGRFILQMTPELFDAKKLARVLGPEYMKSAISERYPQGISEAVIEAFLTMVKDYKYDVSVTEADQTATSRLEVFEQLVELTKAGVQVPFDLILDYLDIPNSEDIKKRLTQQPAAAQGAPPVVTA